MNAFPCSAARALLAGAALLASGTAAGDEYETLTTVQASEILSPDLQQSIHHRIQDEVGFDGAFYVFQLESDAGVEQVHSLLALRKRLHEIHTMAQAMIRFEQSDEALRRALQGRRGVGAESVVDILTNPVGTASKLASNLGANLEQTLSGAYLAAAAQAPAAIAGAGGIPRGDPGPWRRSVAAQLGLDVYSSSPDVQGFLDEIAAARAAGRLHTPIATISAADPAGLIRSRGVADAEFEALTRNKTPAELAARNLRLLERMGVGAQTVHDFMSNAALSPTHRIHIVGWLAQLEGVGRRAAVIAAAAGATSEQDALGYLEVTRMLAETHLRGAGLARIDGDAALPSALTRDNRLVLFAPVDRVIWSAETAAIIEQLRARTAALGATEGRLVLSGTLSPRARRELDSRGIAVQTRASR